MEARFVRDALERELKRVRRDIAALLEEEEAAAQAQAEEDEEEEEEHTLLAELISNTNTSTSSSAPSVDGKWDLPLPIPPELDTEPKLLQLVRTCEAAFSGLRLKPAKRIFTSSSSSSPPHWELAGEAGGIVEFAVEFRTNDSRVTHFALTRFPPACQIEVRDLTRLATTRSCLRTWLVGVSEYAHLVGERARVFAEIRSRVADGVCAGPSSMAGIERWLDLTQPPGTGDGEGRAIRVHWTCEWTAIPSSSSSSSTTTTTTHDSPNEFIVPVFRLEALRGFLPEQQSVVEDAEAVSGLVRNRGLEHAIIALVDALLLM